MSLRWRACRSSFPCSCWSFGWVGFEERERCEGYDMGRVSWPVLGTALFFDILAFGLACGALARLSTVSTLVPTSTSLWAALCFFPSCGKGGS